MLTAPVMNEGWFINPVPICRNGPLTLVMVLNPFIVIIPDPPVGEKFGLTIIG